MDHSGPSRRLSHQNSTRAALGSWPPRATLEIGALRLPALGRAVVRFHGDAPDSPRDATAPRRA